MGNRAERRRGDALQCGGPPTAGRERHPPVQLFIFADKLRDGFGGRADVGGAGGRAVHDARTFEAFFLCRNLCVRPPAKTATRNPRCVKAHSQGPEQCKKHPTGIKHGGVLFWQSVDPPRGRPAAAGCREGPNGLTIRDEAAVLPER